MPRRTKIHVGLEIGTSKTCLVVGEVKPDTAVKILGIGVTKTAGVRKGEIYDFPQARACLKDALVKAEDASDVEIGSVFLAITGSHIQGVNNRGTFRLPEGEPTVAPEHVKEASEIARDVHIPPDHVYIHNIIRNYRLDGLEHHTSPVGLFGKTVESDFHIVHGIGTRIQNSIKLVREMPLEVDDVVFSPIATAQLALDREHRDRGALVIDIGGGTTDYALYLDGSIAASGCIPVGGDHVTNDIHLVTGLPFSKAEKLKILEGDASADPARSLGTAKLIDDRGFAEVEVRRSILNEVIRQRLEETLKLVYHRLPEGGVEAIGSGVFLTGGTSLMRGFSELAFDVFKRDIYRPETPEISGNRNSFKDPKYATAIGLIRYAQILETERATPPGIIKKISRLFWFGK
ncbi:cell division protein FtsA [Luteolibacter pohnpeiensis]|uniref:Cell division protein FtsA n=1 Tax=Luteolibacter pohnpeiensis TaxID=454153 RepID=A0A934S6J0_9BACT|nr:cell division protein FtsA [Luteolibacter pohnpeiensis]MBK1883142.1 cell division protein FtsA [Luteolibacter pohnpeiensis]